MAVMPNSRTPQKIWLPSGFWGRKSVLAFEKVTGLKVNYKIVDRRAGDIEKVWADTRFANEELGWKAFQSLEDTLLSAWNWEKKLRGIK